ncbi:hypothetical protein ASG42_25275 [Rhizobium sp. Leaf391]|uniref:DUF6894 family protein n=1 Tax=Rhizobium sp. Leaf391 TaxID=1736360 RepID=UPI000713CF2C|nr:hypothetical protein [Rhizobium sp. Leaf391]KQT02811.1 hypothetical protein ASG42_25275 [Rhizobium sp. Leaf391]
MPHYFFHIRTAEGVEQDPEGITFPSLEDARKDVEAGLVDMVSDEMAEGRGSRILGIDITDGKGTVFASVKVDSDAEGNRDNDSGDANDFGEFPAAEGLVKASIQGKQLR